MKCFVIAVCLLTAAVSAQDRLLPVELIPFDGTEECGVRTGARPELPEWATEQLEPQPAWTYLEELTREERTNARISFDLGLASREALQEAGAIEELWNSGRFADALERLHKIGRFHDPCDVSVGISWRVPIPTVVGTDWGDNIRIGNRDSLYAFSWDKLNGRNSISFCVGMRRSGTSRRLEVYMTTDGGTSWTETFTGSAGSDPRPDIGSCCFGNYFYICYPRRPHDCLGRIMRFSKTTGQVVRLGNDSFNATIFLADTTTQDTIYEMEICSSDDQYPGSRIYCFGRTKSGKLKFAWSDSDGYNWRTTPAPSVGFCHRGLDCAYNNGYEDAFVWASWMYHKNDSSHYPAVAWLDSVWHAAYFNLRSENTWSITGMAAYEDSIFIAYTHSSGPRRYGQYMKTSNAGANWYYNRMPDTTVTRENPSATGRHGLGLATAWREYGTGTNRHVTYFHAGMRAVNWQGPDTINDYRPNARIRPQVEFVSQSGIYGMAYIKWLDSPNPYSLWFNRSNLTGLVESGPGIPARFGLRALQSPGGVNLAFTNPARGPVQFRVFDPAGRLVHSQTRVMSQGSQTIPYAGSISGIYFATIDIGGSTSTAKFTLTR